MVEIAELLELAPAEVQDTLSFYGFFKQDKPHGKTRAWVCRSISCALRGGEEVLEHLCHAAGIQPGETTADGTLTLEFAECLGACEFAPCMLAGNDAAQKLDEGIGRRSFCNDVRNRTHELTAANLTDELAKSPIAQIMPEFEPVLLANIGKPDSHTLRRVSRPAAAIRR